MARWPTQFWQERIPGSREQENAPKVVQKLQLAAYQLPSFGRKYDFFECLSIRKGFRSALL